MMAYNKLKKIAKRKFYDLSEKIEVVKKKNSKKK